jgi:hypothetical protein
MVLFRQVRDKMFANEAGSSKDKDTHSYDFLPCFGDFFWKIKNLSFELSTRQNLREIDSENQSEWIPDTEEYARIKKSAEVRYWPARDGLCFGVAKCLVGDFPVLIQR